MGWAQSLPAPAGSRASDDFVACVQMAKDSLEMEAGQEKSALQSRLEGLEKTLEELQEQKDAEVEALKAGAAGDKSDLLDQIQVRSSVSHRLSPCDARDRLAMPGMRPGLVSPILSAHLHLAPSRPILISGPIPTMHIPAVLLNTTGFGGREVRA